MYLKYPTASLLIREWKLYLPVNTPYAGETEYTDYNSEHKVIWNNISLNQFWCWHNSPGLIKAGSSVSIRFVAIITYWNKTCLNLIAYYYCLYTQLTLTSPRESNPSSWFSSSSIVLCISLSPPEWLSYLQMNINVMHWSHSHHLFKPCSSVTIGYGGEHDITTMPGGS